MTQFLFCEMEAIKFESMLQNFVMSQYIKKYFRIIIVHGECFTNIFTIVLDFGGEISQFYIFKYLCFLYFSELNIFSVKNKSKNKLFACFLDNTVFCPKSQDDFTNFNPLRGEDHI